MSETDYGAENVQVLEGLKAVRKRPGMYIGSTGEKGLHHLVYEVVDNSIDEALAGHCDEIGITIHKDNSITVSDNGRGIPVEEKEDGRPAVEVIMTTLHAGAKFDTDAYKVSGGLHGVGVSVVNALSENLDVKVYKDDGYYKQSYKRGEPQNKLSFNKNGRVEDGTEISFLPDDNIFEETEYRYKTLCSRMRELAFLNPGIKIWVEDERNDEYTEFKYDGGIKEFVSYLNEGKTEVHEDVIYLEGEEDNIEVEIAMQSTDDVQDSIHGFVNNINTKEGGTHMTGFKTSITRIINNYAKDNNLIDIDKLKGEDIRKGLTCVVSVKHPDPQFEGQTKTKLGNSEVEGVVSGVMHDELREYLDMHPDISEKIVNRAVKAAEVRKAAEKEKQITRKNSALESTSLPGKLVDCQETDPSKSELFIVEGDSAGGSAKKGRNPENQAILPLKGKILNVEKNNMERVLNNNEIDNLITALGAGVGDSFDVDDVRYERIFLMVDADSDGAHIKTLVLTLIYNYMKPLLEEGYVYATKPPLFRIKKGGKTYDVMSDEQKKKVIEEKCNGNPTTVKRFKGLGEMDPEQLWETTMNPENRRLKQITVEDAAEADRIFSVLMGSEVEPRKNFIRDKSDNAEWVDI
jgi:DNA gyrase subunit B